MDRDHILTNLTAFNSQLEADAQRDRDAAMWRKVTSMSIGDLYDLADGCNSMAEFIYAINEQ